MAWLNNKTARYASSTVHVTLPSGKVARGDALIKLPPGLNLILQGQAMAGEGNTTLDLERNNLDIGSMLGDRGRIEFRNMRVRNVRVALPRPLCTWSTHAVAGVCRAMRCASLSPTPADPRTGRSVLSSHGVAHHLLRDARTVSTLCGKCL